MANDQFFQGLWPAGPIDDQDTLTFVKSTSSGDLFLGSPVDIQSGVVVAATSGGPGAYMVVGTVVGLLDSSGKPVTNLASAAAGWCIITYKRYQRYNIRMSAAYTETSDIGYTYGFTAETGTVDTSVELANGSNYSQRKLDSTTRTAPNATLASDCPIVTGRLVTSFNNTGSLANALVECTIRATHWREVA